MNNYIKFARETVTDYTDHIDLQHLLAVLIGPKSTPELCGKLSSYGVRRMSELTISELQRKGLTKNQSLRVSAAFQLARELEGSNPSERKAIHSPEEAVNLVMEELRFLKQEHFVCVFLNTKNEVLFKKTVFIGSLNASIVHPRECFKLAVSHSAASLVCFHNHPSGDPSPSREDIAITQRLVECGKIIGIEILDHIVIGDGRFVSLKEKGYM